MGDEEDRREGLHVRQVPDANLADNKHENEGTNQNLVPSRGNQWSHPRVGQQTVVRTGVCLSCIQVAPITFSGYAAEQKVQVNNHSLQYRRYQECCT